VVRPLLRTALNAANAILRPLNVGIIRIDSGGPGHHPASPEIPHGMVLPRATYSPWLADDEFMRCYEIVRNRTLVDQYRCYELWQLGRQLASLPGSFLEVGVWRGGTGCLLAHAAPGKAVYLADTFTGVVKAGTQDTRYTGGEHADTSETIVRELAEELGATNIHILRGIFPEDTGDEVSGPIALLHCDVDVYSSAKDIVEWAMPRLLPGAVVVFDDYGFRGCEGITRLVNEIRERPGFRFVHNLNGHAILIHTAQ